MFQSRVRESESVSRLVRSSSPKGTFVIDNHAEAEVYVAPRLQHHVPSSTPSHGEGSTTSSLLRGAVRSGGRSDYFSGVPAARPPPPDLDVVTTRPSAYSNVAPPPDFGVTTSRSSDPYSTGGTIRPALSNGVTVERSHPPPPPPPELSSLTQNRAAVSRKIRELEDRFASMQTQPYGFDSSMDASNAAAAMASQSRLHDSYAPSAPQPESATQRAARESAHRVDRLELVAQETEKRDDIEHSEHEAFAALAAKAQATAQRILQAERDAEAARLRALEENRIAFERRFDQGLQRRKEHEAEIESEYLSRSRARRPSPHQQQHDSFLSFAHADVSQRLAISSHRGDRTGYSNAATSSSTAGNRTVRFVMTDEQEQAAEETQRQIETILQQNIRRKKKRELMQALLSSPLV